ncbi:MAG: ribose transport system substrate-binding protein [Mycobacterium sp.]|jgi:ribose transport system substrate-binding protein|nr:ribose transport system substrate-binding protein [Mycobacterium sp.]
MRTRRSVLAVLPVVLVASACASKGTGANTAAQAPAHANGVSVDLQEDAKTAVDTSKWKKPGPYKLAMLTQGPINGWGLTWDVTSRYEAKHNPDVKDLVVLPANGDPNKQIASMEDLVQQKPDAILLDPMGRAALAASVTRAMAAGIPVIVCGNGVEGKQYVTYTDVDLYAVAFSAADALAKRLGEKGNVVLFHGIPGVDAAETWKKAAEDAFKQYPKIKIVGSEYANWSVATGKEKAAALLAANSKIDGVWSGGSEMATGAMLAFKDAGRPQPIYGVDNPTNGFLRLAKENGVKFNAFPDPPATIAKACLETAVKVLKGQPVMKFEALPADGFDETQTDQHYESQLNDDFVPPLASERQAYLDAGMQRK